MDIRHFFGGISKKKTGDASTKTEPLKNDETKKKIVSKAPMERSKNNSGYKTNTTKNNKTVEISEEPIVSEKKRDKSCDKSCDKSLEERELECDDVTGNRSKKRDRSKSDGDRNVTKKVTRHRRIRVLSEDESDEGGSEAVKHPTQKKRKKLVSSDEGSDTVKAQPPQRETKKKKTGKKTNIFYDSESDDDDEEPVPKKGKGRRSSRNNSVVLVSDSDKDSPNKLSPLRSFMRPVRRETTQKALSVSKASVNVADFFGAGSVQRKDKVVVSTMSRPTKAITPKDTSDDIEMIIEDEDDFALTLEELDMHTSKQKPTGHKQLVTSEHVDIVDMSPTKSSYFATTIPSRSQTTKHTSQSPCKENNGTIPLSGEPIRRSPRKLVKLTGITPVKPTRLQSNLTQSSPSPCKGQSVVREESSSNTPGTTPSSDKKWGGAGYRKWLHRDAPQSLGSKLVPQGADNCLEGLTFVITGVLDSFERDDAKIMVEKYGGKVTQSVSRKTDYMVVGRDAGESKTLKARQFGLKQIGEDELLTLIRDRPGKKSKYQVEAELQVAKDKKEQEKLERLSSIPHPLETNTDNVTSKVIPADTSSEALLWVDKYKPNNMKRVIGQQGEKSNGVKLRKWLLDWHRNRALGKKPSGFSWGKDDGSGHKAALLSGPPGVGKTTTAQLVCQECGFSYVELNASDTRSKRSLRQVVAESLDNATLIDFIGGGQGGQSGQHHCLIMDEVDGVAGNEDRGGIAELIDLVKQTRIPIICLCNDRSHQKMRSLVNHCYDLRFYRPRVEQIKGAMMTMLYKEGLTVPPVALNEIILAANQDIRQIIHNLSVWCIKDKTLTYEQAKVSAQQAKKNTKMGPFDVCRRVFVDDDESRRMSLIDKSDLFFYDYSLGPLFVQENYINVTPHLPDGSVTRHLSRLARAADSLSDGDVVEKRLRSAGDWSLLPTVAMFSSVFPGEYMRGRVSFQIAFPSWLGKNSATSKTDRQLQELITHMCLKISSNKDALNRDYLPYLRQSLIHPLLARETDGVREVIDLMDNYDLVKEDLDNIMEVTKWSHLPDPMSQLSTKIKSALTRTYNKETHLTPYAINVAPKKGRKVVKSNSSEVELLGEGEEGQEESEGEEDTDVSAFLLKPKVVNEKANSSKSMKTSKRIGSNCDGSKAKGKGRGKGK